MSLERYDRQVSAAPWLIELERSLAADPVDENLATVLVVLASVAGDEIRLDEDAARAAARRALLLLAAGGNPERGLDLNGRAVEGLAAELDEPHRRSTLSIGIERLRAETVGLPHVSEAVRGLVGAPDVAWKAYACSILAGELGADA
jgi:hypothetical protein